MRALELYDYAVIRVVPRVERAAFVTVSPLLSCERAMFLEARTVLDDALLPALYPTLDPDSLRTPPDPIPASFLGGGAFCLMCDLIARTAFAPTEVSISSVTAVFGAPIVIYMMIHRKAA